MGASNPGAAPGALPDPRAAKRAHPRTATVQLSAATALAWGLVGYWSAPLLGAVRLVAVDDASGWQTGPGEATGPVFLIVGTLVAAAFLGAALHRSAAKAFATFKAGTYLGSAAAFGGAAAGMLVAWLADRWPHPEAVGRYVPETGGVAAWGAPDWIAYHAPWLLASALGAVAVLALLRLWRTHGRERWADTKAAEIREHGVRMPGTITDVAFTGSWSNGEPLFLVTVVYTGRGGARQRTERLAAPMWNAPVRGGQTAVWYDPLGDDETVLIELTELSSAYGVDPTERTG